MKHFIQLYLLLSILSLSTSCFAQASPDTVILRDFPRDSASPARMIELTIPSNGSLLAGFVYEPSGVGKHPTLIMLHGYPGSERNLDLAQAIRARGWNVVFFNYRGSWGSQGLFSFRNCVEDAVNVVKYCKRYSDSLQIDTSAMALFGHSMGAWVCLKALAQLPQIKKGFALSTAIYKNMIRDPSLQTIVRERAERADKLFVLNKQSGSELWNALIKDSAYFDVTRDVKALAEKQIVMLDEHELNKPIADALQQNNKNYFSYEVWQTNHGFANKRASLIKRVISFLNM